MDTRSDRDDRDGTSEVVAAGLPSVPPPAEAAEPRPTRPKWIWVAVGVAVLVVVVGVVLGIATRGRPTLVAAMPETLAGEPRFENPALDLMVKGMEAELGERPLLGLYGSPTQPKFMVMAGEADLGPIEAAFEAIGTGFSQGVLGGSGAIDVGAQEISQVGDADLACTPYSIEPTGGIPVTANMCVWTDGATFGLVMSFDPQLDAQEIVPDIREALIR